jgi:hypothetical protein
MTNENHLSMPLNPSCKPTGRDVKSTISARSSEWFESDLPNSKLAEHCPGGNVDERTGGRSRSLVFAKAANFFLPQSVFA